MKASWSLGLTLLLLNLGVFCSLGQNIRIASAYYGPPNGVGVDVTKRVQRFADYGEPFRVSKEILKVDPAPNHRKTLVVIYVANGQRMTDSVRQGEVFYFRNAGENHRETHRLPLRIVKASYGAKGRFVDVTSRVRQLVRNRRSFTVSNQTFGLDPYRGQRKWLKISYYRGSLQHSQQYEEGRQVQLR
jgi:hypothetical protein